MRVSVIICTKDRRDSLLKTINSIKRQTLLPEELIIVDAGVNERLEDELLNIVNNMNLKYIYTEPGLTKQRNIGIKNASGAIIFFFDDDVILDPKYIEKVVRVFQNDQNREIGAVSGRIVNYYRYNSIKGMLTKVILHIFLAPHYGDGKFKVSGMAPLPHILLQGKWIQRLSGCCMTFRKEVFKDLAFDEMLSGYSAMEDLDISKRVSDRYKIFYEPEAKLIHKKSVVGRLDEFQIARMTLINQHYLFKKNWPQTLPRKLAFWWGIIGSLTLSIFTRNLNHLRGTLAGIYDVVIKEARNSIGQRQK